MLLIKICFSALIVIGITWAAERISPRFAGVLLGFPLGAGLTLFFLGVEQGPMFASASALWTIPGMTSLMLFCYGYRKAVQLLPGKSFAAQVVPVVAGLLFFFTTAAALQWIPQLSLEAGIVLTIIALAVSALAFRRGDHEASVKAAIKVTPVVIALRALSAAFVIVVITEIAHIVGPGWSGLFSAFPITLLPVVVLLRWYYGPPAVIALFRELPQGMLAIVVFAASISLLYPKVGVYLGTFLAYCISGCYLLFYEFSLRHRLGRFLDAIIDRLE